jgi:hypothetical protein
MKGTFKKRGFIANLGRFNTNPFPAQSDLEYTKNKSIHSSVKSKLLWGIDISRSICASVSLPHLPETQFMCKSLLGFPLNRVSVPRSPSQHLQRLDVQLVERLTHFRQLQYWAAFEVPQQGSSMMCEKANCSSKDLSL